MIRASVVAILSLMYVPLAVAQDALPPLRFEVASIKQRVDNTDNAYYRIPPNGTVSLTNATLRAIIVRAYELSPFTERFLLQGGPEKLLATRFDVQAKPPSDAGAGQQFAMLRMLLADRFGLKLRKERRPVPVYGLTVSRAGRLGPSLHLSDSDCGLFLARRRVDPTVVEPVGADGKPLCRSNYRATRGVQSLRDVGPIDTVVKRAQPFVDRPIVDLTGLTKNYDWSVSFGFGATSDQAAPSIFTAFDEELGLKLVPQTAMLDVWVIDDVHSPTPD